MIIFVLCTFFLWHNALLAAEAHVMTPSEKNALQVKAEEHLGGICPSQCKKQGKRWSGQYQCGKGCVCEDDTTVLESLGQEIKGFCAQACRKLGPHYRWSQVFDIDRGCKCTVGKSAQDEHYVPLEEPEVEKPFAWEGSLVDSFAQPT